MSKNSTLWDICTDLTFAISDMEKLSYLANSIYNATAISLNEQKSIDRGELLYRYKEVNTITSILLDELAEMETSLTDISTVAENLYTESNKTDKATEAKAN